MTDAEYAGYFCGMVHRDLREFWEGVAPWYRERGRLDGDSLSYFQAHLKRFMAIITLAKACGADPRRACEVGSFYPYSTAAWPSAQIDLYDIIPRICPTAKPYDTGRIRLHDVNVCTEPFSTSGHDLVVLSEVMEHIPIDLHVLEEKVTGLLAPGGLLIATYPMGGHNPRDYFQQVGDPAVLYHEHLREFTEATIPLFFTKLKTLLHTRVDYRAYGRIDLVAYSKEAAPCQ